MPPILDDDHENTFPSRKTAFFLDADLKNRFPSTKLPLFMDGSLKNKHIFFISKEIRFALNYLRDVVGALAAGAGSSKAQFSYVPFTADLTADVPVIVAEDTGVWKICCTNPCRGASAKADGALMH